MQVLLVMRGLRLTERYFWSFSSSGTCNCATGWVVREVPKECIAFIFRPKEYSSWNASRWRWRHYKRPEPLSQRHSSHTTTLVSSIWLLWENWGSHNYLLWRDAVYPVSMYQRCRQNSCLNYNNNIIMTEVKISSEHRCSVTFYKKRH